MKNLHTKEVVAKSAQFLSAKLIVAVFSVGFLFLLTRLFELKELSFFAVFVIMSGLMKAVSNLGLKHVAIKKIPGLLANQKKIRAARYAKTLIFFPTVINLFFLGIIFFLSKEISSIFFGTSEYQCVIYVLGFCALFFNLLERLENVLESCQKFKSISAVLMGVNFGQRILGLILFFYGGTTYFFIGFGIGFLIGCLFYLYMARDLIFAKTSPLKIKKLLKYAWPFYGTDIMRYLFIQGDQLLVGIFLAPEILAVYYIARRLLDFLVLITEDLLRPLTVKISELKTLAREKAVSSLKTSFRVLTLFVLPICFWGAGFSYFILLLVGGEEIAVRGWLIASILILSCIPFGYYALFFNYLYILGHPIERLKSFALPGLFNLGAGIILINLFKENGIAFAKVLTFILGTTYTLFLLRKLIKIKIAPYFFLKVLGQIIISTAVIVVLQVFYFNAWLAPIYFLVGFFIFLFGLFLVTSKAERNYFLTISPLNIFRK